MLCAIIIDNKILKYSPGYSSVERKQDKNFKVKMCQNLLLSDLLEIRMFLLVLTGIISI